MASPRFSGARRAGQMSTETKPGAGPSGLENLNKWDPSAQQAFIQPAIHNKNPVRVAAVLTASALAAKGSLLVPGNLAKVKPLSRAERQYNGAGTHVREILIDTHFRSSVRDDFCGYFFSLYRRPQREC